MKTTSIALGDHFTEFIARQIREGRYGNASEVIRASLRLLEEHEQQVELVRRALIAGEAGGDGGVLNFEAIREQARRRRL
jgi:antitoxin ParD1/3/4